MLVLVSAQSGDLTFFLGGLFISSTYLFNIKVLETYIYEKAAIG